MAYPSEFFSNLTSGYLFPEIARRIRAWQEKNPGQKVMRLGIGNTTEPLTPQMAHAMKEKIDVLACRDT